jgi:hypothetical protein
MQTSPRLPKRFPVGTKYVLESRGKRVRRYIEYPDGRRIKLESRNAATCTCLELQKLSIVPDKSTPAADVPSLQKTAIHK